MSLNVEGLTGNLPYLLDCAKDYDFLFIQEHWLFSCNRNSISTAFPDYSNSIACTDNENPLSQHCLPRGWGGVAVLWKKSLNPFIRPVEVCSQRIVAVQLIKDSTSTLLVNVYMPSGNTPTKKAEYLSVTAQLKSLLDRFSSFHIVLAGDFNMDLNKQAYINDPRRIALVKLAEELSLQQIIPNYPPTMIAHNGRDVSSIDMVFTSNNTLCTDGKVLEKVPWNTSCHAPISFSLSSLRKVPTIKKPIKTHTLKSDWSTLNKITYNNTLTAYLTVMDLSLIHPHPASQITNLMFQASTFQATEVHRISSISSRKTTFPVSVLDAIKKSRRIHHTWKSLGRPDHSHPITSARRKSSRAVRSALRTLNAQRRESKYRRIMVSTHGDQKLFHNLVKEHQVKSSTTDNMIIDGEISSDPAAIREAWADYYEDLATPKDKPDWSSVDLEEVKVMVSDIASELRNKPKTTFISTEDVRRSVSKLNKGKAPDLEGVRAEHLAAADNLMMKNLAHILNCMLSTGASSMMKAGKKIPIHKKNKPISDMSSYRGITIASTIGKLYESILHDKAGNIEQSNSQFGFTAGLSPLMAAVIITEASAEAKHSGSNLFIATLDTEKAFDVVSHPILFKDLFHAGIPADVWLAILDMYDGISERVLWKGKLSRPYHVHQGVGQGRILSPSLYKIYMNGVLNKLQQSGAGFHIGIDFVGAPTVADDIILLDTVPRGLQSLLDTAKNESIRKRYNIHPVKSEVTSSRKVPVQMQLGSNPMPFVDSITHLGIDRSMRSSNSKTINNRVSTATNTMYALMPCGLYGENGLSPHASRKIITSYVLPRLIYGLESLVLSKTELLTLERAYKQLLRTLLTLREGTADEAVYFLIGLPPLEAELDIRILSIFGNITRLCHDHPLRRIALRQISFPSAGKEGWFKMVLRVSDKYNLKDLLCASLISPWSKLAWKSYIRKVVLNYWIYMLKANADCKSSLRFMITDDIQSFSVHHLWPRGGCASRPRVAASYRAKILSGSYILQSNRARFNQNQINPTCPLCHSAPEDLPHFILTCPSLDNARTKHLPSIFNAVSALGLSLPTNPEARCVSILNMINPKDCNLCHGGKNRKHSGIIGLVSINRKCMCTLLNERINILCIDLHNCRSLVLSRKGKSGS